MRIACPYCGQRMEVGELPPLSQTACLSCHRQVTVPQWFGKWLLEERLKEEEGVEIFRALDPSLDREACVMRVSAAAFPLEEREAFLERVRLQASIAHPGVSSVYACGHEGEWTYAVTQFVGSGKAVLQRRLTPEMAMEQMRQAVSILRAAAAVGLYHGALTPKVLQADADGRLHIGGFGVAAALRLPPPSLDYCAPEFRPGQEPSLAGDMYSMGICWQTLYGDLPGLPESLRRLFHDMSAESPADRPNGYPVLAEALGMEPAATEPEPSSDKGSDGSAAAASSPRPYSLLAIVLAVSGIAVLLLLFAMILWNLWGLLVGN